MASKPTRRSSHRENTRSANEAGGRSDDRSNDRSTDDTDVDTTRDLAAGVAGPDGAVELAPFGTDEVVNRADGNHWPRLVAAPDKFRFTATAQEIADAIARGASKGGWDTTSLPLADGGEGTLEVLALHGGVRQRVAVKGPLGDRVMADYLLDGETAYIEMAKASGLSLVGSPEQNDPLVASTTGTGQLIMEAVLAGARTVVVLVGGSATTDGGLGAIKAMRPLDRLRGVKLVVACDVDTPFLDAAEVFAPQKGASPPQVALLRRRLEALAGRYEREYGVDVTAIAGAGAAGGLAGGLAALGAQIVSGFGIVADVVGLADAIGEADLVVTGEGFLDAQSFVGKVVGGVCLVAAQNAVPVLAVVGDAYDVALDASGRLTAASIAELGLPEHLDLTVVSLTSSFEKDKAWSDPTGCVSATVAAHLASIEAMTRTRG